MAGLRWSPQREISKPARLAHASAAGPPPDDPAPINLPVQQDTALLTYRLAVPAHPFVRQNRVNHIVCQVER